MITALIEQHLKAIDQATFQRLMNELLWLKGYHFLGSPGAVVGRNKTSTGTPDSFFENGDGYVFCEYTTKELTKGNNSFFKKLKKDVDHCFDEAQTGISHDMISKVVLAFTEKITPKEYDDLKNLVRKNNPASTLETYNVQQIAFYVEYFPGLAKHLPGITISAATIYSLHDFLETTTRGVQPPLTNKFSGREEEIKLARQLLAVSDILILNGKQGVGKSKLAVEITSLLERENGYEPRVIVGSPVSVWDDLKTYMLADHKYIILFDDGNKALPNLEYLTHFIRERPENSIKVVLTVRDYAREALESKLSNSRYSEINVPALDGKQIQQIVLDSVPEGITLTPYAIERIVALAKGNSRLALMATAAVLKTNSVKDLHNAETLYNEYFKGLAQEVGLLKKPGNLSALGVLSFFGVMDRNDTSLSDILCDNFGLDWNEFWEIILEFEKAELVDVYESQTARVSDQVLTSYGFFKAFIDPSTATISYSRWIQVFLQDYHRSIQNSLADVTNTFGYYDIRDRLNDLVTEVQASFEGDDGKMYQFYTIFWFLKDFDTLLYVRNWVERLEQQELLSDQSFTASHNHTVYSQKYVELLTNFWYHNTKLTKLAMDIGLQIAFRQPSRIPDLLKMMIDNFSFHRYDFEIEYIRQVTFLDALENPEFKETQRQISDRMFLALGDSFLECESTETQGSGDGRLTMYTFQAPSTEALKTLRTRVLQKAFSLCPKYAAEVLKILDNYVLGTIRYDSELFKDEQPLVSNFINETFNADNYHHCKIVKDYSRLLAKSGINPAFNFERFIESDLMKLARLFSDDDFEVDYGRQSENRKSKVKELLMSKDPVVLDTILQRIHTMAMGGGYTDGGTQDILTAIAELDAELFYKAIELITEQGYQISINEGWFIRFAIAHNLVETRRLYSLLNGLEYAQKQVWKDAFFTALKPESIDDSFLIEFVDFLTGIKTSYYASDMTAFDNYSPQFLLSKSRLKFPAGDHSNFVTYAAEILLSVTTQAGIFFGRHVCEKCVVFFSSKVLMLKDIYMHQKMLDPHYDYSGSEMAAVSTLDHFFLIEFIERMPMDTTSARSYVENLDISFVWDYADYEDIIYRILELLVVKAPVLSSFEHPTNVFFKKPKNKDNNVDKMLSFVSAFISKHHTSKKHTQLIMNIVVHSFYDQFFRFFKEFLMLNKDFTMFRSLLFWRSGAYVGSRVPSIDREIEFVREQIKTIKALPNPLDYANHLSQLERTILGLQDSRAEELKRDFKGI